MNPYLFPGLEFGPATIERLIGLIPQNRLDDPLDPGRFGPREIVAHLADWEPILLQRMRTSRETPGATIQAHDEGKLAEDHGYKATDPIEQAASYRMRRAETIAWLRTLGPEDWGKHGVHTERGRQTVYDQANLLLGHDLYHIEQLSAYL